MNAEESCCVSVLMINTSLLLKDLSYLPHGNIFGGVLVAPRSDWYVLIVDVRVASPSAKPASSQ